MSYIKRIMKMHGTLDFLDLLTAKTKEFKICQRSVAQMQGAVQYYFHALNP